MRVAAWLMVGGIEASATLPPDRRVPGQFAGSPPAAGDARFTVGDWIVWSPTPHTKVVCVLVEVPM